jgi:serine/threonine protein kinase
MFLFLMVQNVFVYSVDMKILEQAVPPVIHRDLKSANILLDRLMRAKVSQYMKN